MYKAMLKSNDRSENDQNFESDVYIGDDCIIKDEFSCDNITCNDILTKNVDITTKVTSSTVECMNLNVTNNIQAVKALFSSNSLDTAVEIRQTGSGDCFKIEDNTNPDITHLRVDSEGNLAIAMTLPNTNKVDINGSLGCTELAKTNIIDGDNYLVMKAAGLDTINKRNQFLRFRSGGNPLSYSGLCFSSFDSNHLRFFKSGNNFIIGRSTEVSATPSNASFTDNVMSISSVTGSIAIGTTLPNASAILDLTSTSKALLIPRMTTVERNAIASSIAGMVLYDTTLNSLCTYNGTSWIALSQNLSSSFIRLAKTANQTAQGAITFNDNIINGSDYSFTSGGSTLTINTTGYYKVEASFTFINTAQEKEIYLNFAQLTPTASTLCFSIDSCGTYDTGTTYSNSTISDILLLTAGRTYNFSYSSQTGSSSTLYSTSRAHLTRIT